MIASTRVETIGRCYPRNLESFARCFALSTENFIRDAFKDDITLEGGMLAKECAALYVPPGADVPKDQHFNR
jgi:hypothetical protein